MRSKIVLCSPNPRGRGLYLLACSLSRKVGYRVYRVTPDRVRRRRAIHFHAGMDKITQFHAFHVGQVAAPAYTTTVDRIHDLPSKQVVARKLIHASEGKGITIFVKGETPPAAPLYTEYIPKKKEFRVHVWNGEVIDVTEKRKRTGYTQERNTQIRNTANGYVFCRSDVVEPDGLRALALRAVASLGRSYGAVDCIYNAKRNECFVLEVNSKPGMEGLTVERYANAILRSLT